MLFNGIKKWHSHFIVDEYASYLENTLNKAIMTVILSEGQLIF